MSHEIVWFEVMGKDLAASQAFYGELFGWSFEPGPGGMPYGMVSDRSGVGGGIGAGPHPWATFYVGVDDVDATLTQATGRGAEVLMPATDLPGGGRIAVFADPDGLPVGIAHMG